MEDLTLALSLGLAAVAAAVLLVLWLSQRKARQDDLRTHYEERERLHGESRSAQEDANKAAVEAGQFRGLLDGARRELETVNSQLAEAESRLEQATQQLARLGQDNAQLAARFEHAERANAELRKFLDEAQDKLKASFAELAGKVFDERGRQFAENVTKATQQSKNDIDTLLKPFVEKLGEFRQRVDTLYGEEARERASLLGAVNQLKSLNEDMAGKAAELARALKGNAKVRGDWGELMLESVLRGSGLEEGQHYEKQATGKDEDGNKLRPDVVVHLPDERRVVVDSKLNLIDWQHAVNAQTPQEHDEALRQHVVALKQHIKELAEKNYPRMIGDKALDITIAFVPIEGALSAALGVDPGLQGYAFERKIAFASPNTLMAMLRVVERLWTRDKISREAESISKAGQLLLDSVINFVEDFDEVGHHLKKARDAFDDARRKLSESDKAVIPRARRLVGLRIKGKKSIPEELQPDSEQDIAGLLGNDDSA